MFMIAHELTILSDISCAAVEVIWPYRFVRAIFHLTCLEREDEGSTLIDEFSVNSAWCFHVFLFSSINFFSRRSYPPRDSKWG